MSIGRSQGPPLPGTSLPAHPLLSPAPSALSSPSLSPSTSLTTPPTTGTTPPKYIPYTPRHRPVASTSTTTASALTSTNATAIGSPTSSSMVGGATRELQRQNMKSEVQGMGLSGESAGWGMLERLSGLGAADEEWEEVWALITVGKEGQATLLLPREPLPNSEITADLVRDHIVFLSPPSSSAPTPLVTASGLRGTVTRSTLAFRSSLPTDSAQYAALLSAPTRGGALHALPPLPLPTVPGSQYPTFLLPGTPLPIPLPARPSPVPPPLPTRPTQTQQKQHHTTRLSSLPFASLFGTRPPAAAPAAAAPPPAPPPNTSSSTPTARPGTPGTPGEGPTISVWPVDHILRTRDISLSIHKSVRSELKLALSGLPSWLPDRVNTFLAPYLPVVKQAKPSKLRTSLGSAGPPSPGPELAPSEEAFQAFYKALGADLGMYYEHSSSPTSGSVIRRGSKELDRAEGEDLSEKEREVGAISSPREALDRVESVLCTLLYDRLFCPAESDDARHDEALASRVAALNMLDLGLGHLGVDVLGSGGEAGGEEGVEEVVRACGLELQKLAQVQAPKEKAQILVVAHKLVAEGLARLPPLRLRPDEEEEEGGRERELTARPMALGQEMEMEMEQEMRTARPEEYAELTAKPLNGFRVEEQEQELQEHVNGDADMHRSMEQELEQAQLESVTSPAGDTDGQDALVRTPPVPALRFPSERAAEEEEEKVAQHAQQPPPLPPRHTSVSPSPAPQATAAADLMLPLIIFAVVKSNPAQLVSHLLYVQRYRDTTVGGEENYCLINLSAVVEFLEHVDLGVLGLGGQEKVLSIDDLTPIPLVRSPQAQAQAEAVENMSGRLRGTVTQVGELAASTNKVISGVVDSSFSALRGLLSQGPLSAEPLSPTDDLAKIAPWNSSNSNSSRPGFGLLRRASGFSIASMAASLPGGHGRTRSMHAREEGEDEEGGRPLVDVSSRANSIREEVETESEEEGSDEETTGTSGQTEDEEEEEGGEEERGYRSDVRSVRSFSSMMSRESRERDERRERMSIHDRLAHMAAGRFNPKGAQPGQAQGEGSNSRRLASPPRSRRTSLLSPTLPAGYSNAPPSDSRSPSPGEQSPALAPAPLPLPLAIPKIQGPNTRFMSCSPDELRLSEIGELLREYRRVVGALKEVGGFEE
ncbi:hypothetical protein CALVIDRAFT_552043 [Calocera viscosa TUFC12733]|uniref:VPS9 domain-containing protein n=1 Tax=Calocera viscosa (strain TUFC12733) TaxID=1330018 RepID=A0A167S9Q1_CALVF|nr:hypothetical protein CALVIDRAFT_552043 [Calocera viscosa TUFC12733]